MIWRTLLLMLALSASASGQNLGDPSDGTHKLLPPPILTQVKIYMSATATNSLSPTFPDLFRSCCGLGMDLMFPAHNSKSFGSMDSWVNVGTAHAARNLMSIYRIPKWMNGGANNVNVPTHITTSALCPTGGVLAGQTITNCEWKETIHLLMRHYCSPSAGSADLTATPGTPLTNVCRIRNFEMGNENNVDQYWTGTNAQFAVLSNDTAKIIRLYCGDCTILGGSFAAGGRGSHANGEVATFDGAMRVYLAAWLAISGASLPDEISYHPYSSWTNVVPVPFPTTNISASSSYCTPANVPNSHCETPIINQAALLRAILNESALSSWPGGAGNLPIIATEGGYSKNPQTVRGTQALTDNFRRAFGAQWVVIMAENGNQESMWYAWGPQDWGTEIGTGVPLNGETFPNGVKTPLYFAMTQAGTWMANSAITINSLTSVVSAPGKVWFMNYTHNSLPSQVAWFDQLELNVTYTTPTLGGTRAGHMQDILGNVTVPGATVTLGNMPVLFYP